MDKMRSNGKLFSFTCWKRLLLAIGRPDVHQCLLDVPKSHTLWLCNFNSQHMISTYSMYVLLQRGSSLLQSFRRPDFLLKRPTKTLTVEWYFWQLHSDCVVKKKPFASLLSLALVDCCSSSPWAKTQTALRPLSQQRIFIDLSITLESQIFFVLLCFRVKIVGIGVFIIVQKEFLNVCSSTFLLSLCGALEYRHSRRATK